MLLSLWTSCEEVLRSPRENRGIPPGVRRSDEQSIVVREPFGSGLID